MPGLLKTTEPSHRKMAEYLHEVCSTRSEQYAIDEITRRLEAAYRHGKKVARAEIAAPIAEIEQELAGKDA